ncbi:TPA: YggT family protein [Candidatus Avigastranaerophilus faecigallinarum]|nr:YggT family protein [Candidatus Avigastranaerophilus faecigallinarum]
MISYIVSILFKIIYLIILVVVLLSWFPPIFDARKEPLATCIKIYNYIMAPFKAIIPPIGMIDISPLVAFIVLQIAEQIIVRALMNFGL